MTPGDIVERRQPVSINSCPCVGCWRGHNRGTVRGVQESVVAVLFGFGKQELLNVDELRVLDPIEVLGELHDQEE